MKQFLRFADLQAEGIVQYRSTLHRWIEKEDFPKPYQLGANTIAWNRSEIYRWLGQRRVAATAPVEDTAA